jgi:tripartite-type tricarboxylate transporter receptor subunit TctC
MHKRNVLFLLAAALLPLHAMAAAAPYPVKLIKIIVPFPAGSGTDTGELVNKLRNDARVI